MADLRVEDATTGPSMSESRRATYREAHNRWGGKAGMSHCNIGVLAAPFMRAALVIDVNTLTVTATSIRPARFYNNFKNGYFSRLIPPRLSPTWVVPTRHPEALSQALQAVPGHQGPVRPRYEGRSCS